ncbi:MAG: hypothetical protein JST59_00130 [Actinobacteria bacterium]|nr:hypothetical protein [Actinomycetota bacterium]
MKIRNFGIYNRDVLNQKRSRALMHILRKKLADELTAKQTFLYRWHFLLTSRHHYLAQLLDTLSRSVMLSPFYRIREHAYWHSYYINKHAERAMNENKTQTKADMNLLLEENIDPEEIKSYMKNKNAKDTNMIRSVVCKLRVMGDRPLLVRGWHSWKEYLMLKTNIKKALTKMFIICDGKGKYWNRWRGKDEKFVGTLKKESRGNMVSKYHDLVRLLKEYRKDVKTNIARTEELATINQEYEQGMANAKFVALKSMSHFIRKGMSRTLRGWREKIIEIRQL